MSPSSLKVAFPIDCGRVVINSLDSRSFNSGKSCVDVGKENNLFLINGHNPSAIPALKMYCFPIYSLICSSLPGFPLMPHLFWLKAFSFLSIFEVLYSLTKQVLTG